MQPDIELAISFPALSQHKGVEWLWFILLLREWFLHIRAVPSSVQEGNVAVFYFAFLTAAIESEVGPFIGGRRHIFSMNLLGRVSLLKLKHEP